MWTVLGTIKRRLTLSISVAMAAGLALGWFWQATPLRAAIVPVTIAMILPMMVALDLRALLLECSPGVQAATQAVNFVAIPLLAFGLGHSFFAHEPMAALGLLLVALIPTSGMTVSWTGFAHGNIAMATKMTVLGTLLGTLLAPFYAKGLMGTVVEISLVRMFEQIGLVVFLPLVLGILMQWGLQRRWGAAHFKERIKPRLPVLSTVGLLALVFVVMALKARVILSEPLLLLELLPVLVLFYAAAFAVASVVGRFFGREDGVALVYSTAVRKVAVALAIAVAAFGEEAAVAALVVSGALVVQVQAAALYLKVVPRIFPERAEARTR